MGTKKRKHSLARSQTEIDYFFIIMDCTTLQGTLKRFHDVVIVRILHWDELMNWCRISFERGRGRTLRLVVRLISSFETNGSRSIGSIQKDRRNWFGCI